MLDHILLDDKPFGFTPGGFLGVELRPHGELYAVCAFFFPCLEVGKYYPARGSDGLRYQVKIPECQGIKNGLYSILGDQEPGLESRFIYES